MSILVLYAGGTIGMGATANGYQPTQGFEALLKNQISLYGDQLPEFDVVSFEKLIDSANLSPSDWTYIGQQLLKHWNNYDGFILLHGTDTMAYTASMLSFMLQGCDKPVIVTGSQVPMIEARNDAVNNFINALIFTQETDITEVCLCFNGLLLRGNRATKISSKDLEAFDSPNYPRLGKADINIALNKNALLTPKNEQFQVVNFTPSAVTIVYIYPGIQASALKAQIEDESLKGLVLCTYGAGNPPAADVALMQVLKAANDRGVCIVNISQCLKGGVSQGVYATGSALGKVGVISGYDMTTEAAFTKLHYLVACGLTSQEIKQKMSLSLCGESTHTH